MELKCNYHFVYPFAVLKQLSNYNNKMPGHVKKTEGPDPDPSPWLIVSDELKVKLKAKPYDAKKSCWVPDKATGGYFEGLIEGIEGEKATVKILDTGDVSIVFCSS